jgi:hypothetical protein
VTYTAQFDKTIRTYTVTWNNRDGTNLETDSSVPYSDRPSYNGEIPHKHADETHRYIFIGWTKLVDGNPVSVDIDNETVV